MTIAAPKSRDDRLRWLLRPIEWAGMLATWSAMVGITIWYRGGLTDAELVPFLLGALVISSGLHLWGLFRISWAANGR